MYPIQNTRVGNITPLISPKELIDKYPVPSLEIQKFIYDTRNEIADIIHGNNNKLLLIIGPCSIHDPISALEYAEKLSVLAQEYYDKMIIVMRVYFEKPRTTVGWKGFIYDPYLDNSCDISTGLEKSRELMINISKLKLPIACEFLDTITPQYFSDLVSWGAIGARTTESQVHRQLASGLSMPIGFKNGTDGNVKIAIDGMIASSASHAFCGINDSGMPSIVHTIGNNDTHIVLRGSSVRGPNYYLNYVIEARQAMNENNFVRKILIDCSHDNSEKNYLNQKKVFMYCLDNYKKYPNLILGMMLESNLLEGKQTITNLEQMEYGKSVTDGCIGWEETCDIICTCYKMI
jgi:3-deoxy-7-phosphoheptulonate synthase